MAIKNVIIHHVSNALGNKDINLNTASYEVSEQTSYILGEVKSSFLSRASKRHGVFSDESGLFKSLTLNWLSSELNFIDYTQKATEQLALSFEQEGIETEGHWLFVEEQIESESRLWLFQLKQKSGLTLTSNLEISEASIIDFAKLGFGAMINLTELQNAQQGSTQQEKYLSLSFGFGDKALQAMMVSFFNFIDTLDTKADTQEFMSVISAFSETLPEQDAPTYRKKAAEYCIEQDMAGEMVNYTQLAEEVDSSKASQLVDFIQQESPDTKPAFVPDRKSLKQYIRYSGKSKEVSISFSNEILGKNVMFDPSSETLTISELPLSLLKQLKSDN